MAIDVEHFSFKNLNIDHQTLKLLNLKESRLQRIEIHKGNVKTLDADLVPVTVGKLTLLCMGIQQLPDSFENLKIYRSWFYQEIN